MVGESAVLWLSTVNVPIQFSASPLLELLLEGPEAVTCRRAHPWLGILQGFLEDLPKVMVSTKN